MPTFLRQAQDKLFSVNKLNQKGVIAQGLVLLLLLGGIAAGLYLVQHPQILRPKAASDKVEWVNSESGDPDNCVTTKDGKAITTCPKVKFKINIPELVAK